MAATAQHFNLRWNNHTSNILQVFLEQYISELLVDVTISCQGKFLKAHKMVLSACSPYFQELFHRHDTQHPIVILYGMKYDHVKSIIEFMYRGEIKVLESDLDALLEVAEALQIKGLSNVRNKYQRGDIQDLEEEEEDRGPRRKKLKPTSPRFTSESEEEGEEEEEEEGGKKRPSSTSGSGLPSPADTKPDTTESMSAPVRISGKGPSTIVRVHVSNNDFNNDDLPATIKVEPPDIRDIDEDSPMGWESPRLVIDLPELPAATRRSPAKSMSAKVRGKRLSPLQGTSRQADALAVPSGTELKIPRPPNAFMIFANEWRRKLAFQHPSENNKEISVRLGFMWKSLPSEDKETYYTASRRADLEHKQKYPGYYYSPKEARLRKRLKQRPGGGMAVEAMQLVRVFMNDEDSITRTEETAE